MLSTQTSAFQRGSATNSQSLHYQSPSQRHACDGNESISKHCCFGTHARRTTSDRHTWARRSHGTRATSDLYHLDFRISISLEEFRKNRVSIALGNDCFPLAIDSYQCEQLDPQVKAGHHCHCSPTFAIRRNLSFQEPTLATSGAHLSACFQIVSSARCQRKSKTSKIS